jgi:hypothetical protein
MKRSSLIAVLASLSILAACGSGGADPTAPAAGPAAASPTAAATEAAGTTDAGASRIDALAKSGVPTPGSLVETLEPSSIDAAARTAAAEPGSRGAFQDFHDTVAPIRPMGRLRLAALAPAQTCATVDGGGNADGACPGGEADPGGGGGGGQGDPAACPRVCSTACASANATAVAAAFAHASATACAFAEAWACVFESTAPFNRVCAWARSQACATTFATAFGFGFAVSNDQECRTVCSDGTVTVTNGPPPAQAPVVAPKSLLRPNT